MKKALKVGNIEAGPGKIAKGPLGHVEVADGSKAEVPLIIVNGAEDGPILTVVAAVHGNEICAVGALLDVIKKTDPAQLRGALIGIPGANPLAIRVGTRYSYIECGNLGAWDTGPLNQESDNITRRLAYIVSHALEKADYVLDMHSNPFPAIPYVGTAVQLCPNENVKKEVKKIAEAYGVTIINHDKDKVASIRDLYCYRGVPALTPELVGGIFMWESITQVGTRGIMNIMKAVGMIDGQIEKQEAKIVTGDLVGCGRLYAQRGGYMYAKKEPGDLIKKGETVFDIVNAYGDVVQEVKMPVNGYCWAFTGGFAGSHAIGEGDPLAYVFTDRSELKS